MSRTETFVPYNNQKDYMLVDFIQFKKTDEMSFDDIIVVKYNEKEYELLWDNRYYYYSGNIDGEKGFIP